ILGDDGRDGIVEARRYLLQDGLFIGLEREQRLRPRRIDAADQREFRAVVGERDRGPLALVALLHGLADVAQRDRTVDVDELAVLAKHVKELAKVLIRHSGLRQSGTRIILRRTARRKRAVSGKTVALLASARACDDRLRKYERRVTSWYVLVLRCCCRLRPPARPGRKVPQATTRITRSA